MKWTILKELRKARSFQVSLAILYILPIIGKLVSLPISIKLVFFSSLFATLFEILFRIFCPKIIQKDSKKNASNLISASQQIIKSNFDLKEMQVREFLDVMKNYVTEPLLLKNIPANIYSNRKQLVQRIGNLSILNNQIDQMYLLLLDYSDSSRPLIRYIISIFLILSLVLALVVWYDSVRNMLMS